jgi:hypothetical protein
MLIRFSAGLWKRTIPSSPWRIELILAKGPQAVQPGIVSSTVLSAATAGTAPASNARITSRPKTLFAIIAVLSSRDSRLPGSVFRRPGSVSLIDRTAEKIQNFFDL